MVVVVVLCCKCNFLAWRCARPRIVEFDHLLIFNVNLADEMFDDDPAPPTHILSGPPLPPTIPPAMPTSLGAPRMYKKKRLRIY